MNYWENSIIYRAISGSWFLGWLVSIPGERSDCYSNSYAYRLGNNLAKFLTRYLQRLGRVLIAQGKTSAFITNPAGFVGLLVFFYFGFDLSLNDYGLKRTLIEILLMITGLLLPALKPYPGIYRGSIIYRFCSWWTGTD